MMADELALAPEGGWHVPSAASPAAAPRWENRRRPVRVRERPRRGHPLLLHHPERHVSPPPLSLSIAPSLSSPSPSRYELTRSSNRTDAEFLSYVAQNWFPHTPRAQLARLLELYPADPAAGSPFGTGDDNQFTPQFKRMAALQGDILFVAPRRLLTRTRARAGAAGQAVYSFCECA